MHTNTIKPQIIAGVMFLEYAIVLEYVFRVQLPVY